jgi:hypothetical protein
MAKPAAIHMTRKPPMRNSSVLKMKAEYSAARGEFRRRFCVLREGRRSEGAECAAAAGRPIETLGHGHVMG